MGWVVSKETCAHCSKLEAITELHVASNARYTNCLFCGRVETVDHEWSIQESSGGYGVFRYTGPKGEITVRLKKRQSATSVLGRFSRKISDTSIKQISLTTKHRGQWLSELVKSNSATQKRVRHQFKFRVNPLEASYQPAEGCLESDDDFCIPF